MRVSGTDPAKAFSLVEMLLVLTITGMLLAFAAPSLLTLKSASLSTAGREFGGFLNLCRSEAISKRTSIRLGVVTQSSKQGETFAKYAAWKWDKVSRSYIQFSNWSFLPSGIAFEAEMPNYIKEAAYAKAERSSIKGDFVLMEGLGNNFDEIEGNGSVEKIRYFTFSPSGRARLESGENRNLIIIMRGDDESSGQVKNWYQFTIDTLTGRHRIYRP